MRTHGKRSTYVHAKCRCEACRRADTEYKKRLKATPLSEDDKRHGKDLTYVNYSCRCERCTQAWAAYKRNRRQGDPMKPNKEFTTNG